GGLALPGAHLQGLIQLWRRGQASDSTNSSPAPSTMDGPMGVSHHQEAAIPRHTAVIPARLPSIAICPGPVAKRRAVAAGITSSAVISSTPTTFMALAITRA